MTEVATRSLTVVTHRGIPDADLCRRWNRLCGQTGDTCPSRRIEWLTILHDGLRHEPLLLEAKSHGETLALLPLMSMRSKLFGKFLVGLPYLNVGGVLAKDEEAANCLIDQAIAIADERDVNHLELRHEFRRPHLSLNHELTEKVHMRLDLPVASDDLWQSVNPKVRNQVRKAEKESVTIEWGQHNLVPDFYSVFSHNMRDLGTPVYGRRLFDSILRHLPDATEICVARHRGRAVAGAILIHGQGTSEVPSASSLRAANHLNCNMLMYWHLLKRSIDRGNNVFDFGRSTASSNTYRFKAQWGAMPHPAVWQYYVRNDCVSNMRPNTPKNQRRIAVWKRLPVWLTRLIGPAIVRGIP